MSDITHVYLVTGFLGSGKTTLLNRIIAAFPPDRKLTLLVNEFGEVGVDGTLVAGDDIDMLEISKGSIFCICVKTDFIKGLYELNTRFQPDVLLIESTGVANPSDLKKDLQLPIFNDRFQFREQFCVIDAAHFLETYGVYASLEKQIASSSVFIINKTDLSSTETIAEIREVIAASHPEPLFIETTWADIPLGRFFGPRFDHPVAAGTDPEHHKRLSDEDLERFIDGLLESPDLEITPPDILVSAVYQWAGRDLSEIRSMAGALPPGILRAKGFIVEAGKVLLLSYVMGDWSLAETGLSPAEVKNRNVVVFIAPPPVMNGMEAILKKGSWINRGTFQPFSPQEEKA